jgi:hypothetical protein
MGRAYALSGNRAEPQKLSQKIESDSNRKYLSPYWLAIIHFGLNEMDETFAWLQKAYDERNALAGVPECQSAFRSHSHRQSIRGSLETDGIPPVRSALSSRFARSELPKASRLRFKSARAYTVMCTRWFFWSKVNTKSFRIPLPMISVSSSRTWIVGSAIS